MSGDYPEPTLNFCEGQWWVNELDLAANSSDNLELKRAVATVHHLLKSIHTPAREPDAWLYRNLDGFWNLTRNHDEIWSKAQIEPLYKVPPQPQSVKDALEKALKIMDEKLTGKCWATDLDAAERVIRALIKETP